MRSARVRAASRLLRPPSTSSSSPWRRAFLLPARLRGGGSAAQHQGALPLGRGVAKVLQGRAHRGSHLLLVALGELPGHPHGTIPHHLQQIFQQGEQAMGGFEQHHGALFVPQGLQPLPAGATAGGQKSFEAEAARGQAAAHQGGGDGAGAGHTDHGNGLKPGGGHQLLAGVGNAGQARVAHHRHRLSSRQNLQKLGDAGGLIVLMETDQPRADAEGLQQQTGAARIFTGDAIDAFQHPAGPGAAIGQIADRCAHQIEGAGAGFLGWGQCTRSHLPGP